MYFCYKLFENSFDMRHLLGLQHHSFGRGWSHRCMRMLGRFENLVMFVLKVCCVMSAKYPCDLRNFVIPRSRLSKFKFRRRSLPNIQFLRYGLWNFKFMKFQESQDMLQSAGIVKENKQVYNSWIFTFTLLMTSLGNTYVQMVVSVWALLNKTNESQWLKNTNPLEKNKNPWSSHRCVWFFN